MTKTLKDEFIIESRSSTKVTVIVPTKNEGEMIEACLSSVFDQSVKPFEVIVVDGNSTDHTVEKAREFPVKILFETKPTSPSQARNIGIKNAAGEILLIMDADIVLNHNSLEHALQYFNDPNIMAVIPFQEVPAHTRLEKIQARWFFGTLNPLRMGIGTVSPVQFLRKDFLGKIKYDPTLGYGDDADFHDKLKLLSTESRKIKYVSDVKISVHFPHTVREFRSQYLWYGRTFLKYFFKNHSLKTILNLFSLLMPTVILFFLFLTLFIPEMFYIFLLGFSLLLIRNIIACYRSRSIYLIEFICFEFARSLIFLTGMIKGFFVKKIGR